MKSIITLFSISLLIIGNLKNTYAQVANYAFSETTGSYNTILGNTALASVSGTLGTSSTSRATFASPFAFCIGGVNVAAGQSLTMSHDGWAAFGNPSVTTATSPRPLTNFNNCMSAFGTDLRTTGTSSYGARVIGTAPNRVLILQWGQRYFGDSGQSPFLTVNFWRRVTVPNINGASVGDDTPGNNDRLHFQIRLYETTNVIEFIYCITQARNTVAGNRDAGITSDIQVGLRGASASDFNVRTKTTTNSPWDGNSTAAAGLPSGTTNTMNFNNLRSTANNRPSSIAPGNPGNTTTTATAGTGLIYRWTPVPDPLAPPLSLSNCAIAPLPVDLSEFGAEAGEKVNKIYWTTISEENSDYFIVERSLNGADWDAVGRISAAGNSTSTINYEMEDRAFTNFINYYRLKQVDKDGKTKTYHMVVVDNRESKKDLVKTVNIMGQEVGPFYEGLVIDVYSDGTTEKYYKVSN